MDFTQDPAGLSKRRLKARNTLFDIKSESSYNANLSGNALELALKKTNCLAWVEAAKQVYQDFVLEAKIRLDSLGGYASAGIAFRMSEENGFYLALISSKGYFRFDAIKENSSRPLFAWTEISNSTGPADFDCGNINLKIIAHGVGFIFLVNDEWLGEVFDDSFPYGRFGFAAVSYSSNGEQETQEQNSQSGENTCIACIDYISVDSRARKVKSEYKKWSDEMGNIKNVSEERRLKLAETFAVMGETSEALEQINRALKSQAWKSQTGTENAETRKTKELLLALAGRCHWELENYKTAAAAWDKAFELNSENNIYADNAAAAREMAANKEEDLKRYDAAEKSGTAP